MSAGIRAGDFFPIKRAAACVLLCASNAVAANPVAASATELRGVRAFTLSVEPLDEHAIKCFISTQAIEASARAILQKSKVALRPPGRPNPNSFLYYNVNVISLQRGQCVYSFSLSVRLIGELKMGADHTPQFWMKDPNGMDLEFQQYTERSSQFTGRDVEVDW